MSAEDVRWVFEHSTSHGFARLVLAAIAWRNGERLTQRELAGFSGTSESTVHRSLVELVALGELRLEGDRPYRYVLVTDVAGEPQPNTDVSILSDANVGPCGANSQTSLPPLNNPPIGVLLTHISPVSVDGDSWTSDSGSRGDSESEPATSTTRVRVEAPPAQRESSTRAREGVRASAGSLSGGSDPQLPLIPGVAPAAAKKRRPTAEEVFAWLSPQWNEYVDMMGTDQDTGDHISKLVRVPSSPDYRRLLERFGTQVRFDGNGAALHWACMYFMGSPFHRTRNSSVYTFIRCWDELANRVVERHPECAHELRR